MSWQTLNRRSLLKGAIATGATLWVPKSVLAEDGDEPLEYTPGYFVVYENTPGSDPTDPSAFGYTGKPKSPLMGYNDRSGGGRCVQNRFDPTELTKIDGGEALGTELSFTPDGALVGTPKSYTIEHEDDGTYSAVTSIDFDVRYQPPTVGEEEIPNPWAFLDKSDGTRKADKWRAIVTDRITLDSKGGEYLWAVTRADFYDRTDGSPTYDRSFVYLFWADDESRGRDFGTNPSKCAPFRDIPKAVEEAGRNLITGGLIGRNNGCAFTQDGKLRSVGSGGNVTDYSQSDVSAIGAAEFDSYRTSDIAFLKASDEVHLIDGTDTSPTTIGISPEAKTSKTHLATGRWDGSTESVFYVAATGNGDEIYRVDSSDSPARVANPENGVKALSGIADVDGDGQDELAFVDGSQQLRYVEAGDETTQTFTKIPDGGVGANNNIGVGTPADFDGDGTAEIPIVGGSNQIRLVDADGTDHTLITGDDGEQAAKAPVGVADIDGDGQREIVYIENNNSPGELKYIDDVTDSNTFEVLRDAEGTRITAETARGVTSAVVPPSDGASTGGEDGAAGQIDRVSTRTDESYTLTFELKNTGSNRVTVNEWAMETNVQVNSIQRDGAEVTLGGTGIADSSDGFRVDGSPRRLSDSPTLGSGTSRKIAFGQYDGGNVALTVAPASEQPDGSYVSVTLWYSDSTSETFYFEVTNVNS